MPAFSCASEKNIPKHFDRRPGEHDKYSHDDLDKLSQRVNNFTRIRLSSNLQNFIRDLDFSNQLICGSVSSLPFSFDFVSCHAWIDAFEKYYEALLNLANVSSYTNFFNHARVARRNTKDPEKISQLDDINLELIEFRRLIITPLQKAKKIIQQLSRFNSQSLPPDQRIVQKTFFLLCRVNTSKMDDVRLIDTIISQWTDLWKIHVAFIHHSGRSADAINTVNSFIVKLLVEFDNESDFFHSLYLTVKNHWCARKNSDLLLGEINKALQFSRTANIPLIEAVSQLGKLTFSSQYQLLLMEYYSMGLRPKHLLIIPVYSPDSVKIYCDVLVALSGLTEKIISIDALFQKLSHVPSSQWIDYTYALITGNLFLNFARAKNWSECLSFLQLSTSLKPRFLSVTGPADAQPIHFFAKAGQLELVTLSIGQGASLNCLTQNDKTPIELAAENEHWEVVSKIAEIHATDSLDSVHYGFALYLAAQAEKWDVCELLIRSNASLYFAPYDILRSFCRSGQSSLIQLCFHHEHNQMHFRNSMLITHKDAMPIVLAAKNDHWETVLILRGHDHAHAHSRPIYPYLLNLAVSRRQFPFIKDMLTRYPQHLLSLEIPDKFVCVVALQKYYDAAQLIIQHKEKCFDSVNSHTIATQSDFTDFFTKKCDFRAVELELSLVSKLIAFGVPIDKFRDVTKKKLLTCDDWFALPVVTFYKMIIAKIPFDILQRSLPPSPMHHITVDCTIKINQLNNLNFIEFTRWLCLLKNFLKSNQQAELLGKIRTMLNRCHDVLACGIDHFYLDNLYQQLRVSPSPITLFSRENRPNLTDALKAFYPDIRNLDLMALLVKQYQDVFLTLRLWDVRFQILFYFACFLSRANYPRNLFLPENSGEIGVLLSRCEDHDMDDLIFIGTSFRDAKIIVISEFLQAFNQSRDFTDPVTRAPMDEQTILALLQHPKIRAAVVAADEKEKTDVQAVARYRPILIEVVNKLEGLGKILYDASTDSGRQTFDEEAANRAVIEFRQYSDDLPKLVINALHSPGLSFYLDARLAMTNYSQLFSQMTHHGCSGQLGLTIRQWVSKFRDKEQTVLADMHFTKLSRYLDLMVSMPMNTMYVTQATSRDCRMSGKGFVKALLDQERLAIQPIPNGPEDANFNISFWPHL